MHTYMNSTCMVWGQKCFLSSKLLEQDTDNNFKSFSLHGLIAVKHPPSWQFETVLDNKLSWK